MVPEFVVNKGLNELSPVRFTISVGDKLKEFEGFAPTEANRYDEGFLCPFVTKEVHEQISDYMLKDLKGCCPTDMGNVYFNIDAMTYASQKPNSHGLYYWGNCFCWVEVL